VSLTQSPNDPSTHASERPGPALRLPNAPLLNRQPMGPCFSRPLHLEHEFEDELKRKNSRMRTELVLPPTPVMIGRYSTRSGSIPCRNVQILLRAFRLFLCYPEDPTNFPALWCQKLVANALPEASKAYPGNR